jgi:hypothetical protein
MTETLPELAQYQSDHDILIELRTEMRLLRETVKASFDGTSRIIDDHELRLRAIEKEANRFIGRQSISGAVIGSIVALVAAVITAIRIHL